MYPIYIIIYLFVAAIRTKPLTKNGCVGNSNEKIYFGKKLKLPFFPALFRFAMEVMKEEIFKERIQIK